MSERGTCAVQVYRLGDYRPSEPCGRPMKGVRTTPDDVMWPVCGIHLRAKYGLVERRPGRFTRLRKKGEPC